MATLRGRDAATGRFVSVFVSGQAVIRRLSELSDVKFLLPFMERQASLAAAHTVKNMLTGQRLRRRTGALARSVTGHAVQEGRNLPGFRVGVFRGPALAYARIHEFGGTIRPKRAKNLAIPQEGQSTKAGVSRGGPRSFPGRLHFIPFRSSGIATGALVGETAYRQLQQGASLREVQVAFLLVKKVKIKAQHYLRDGVRGYVPQLVKALRQEIASRLKGAKSGRR